MIKETLQQLKTPEEEQETRLERKEQRMEKIMEARHKNALEALKIEKILSEEVETDEYPVVGVLENEAVRKKAEEKLESLDFGLVEEGEERTSSKFKAFKRVVLTYLVKKTKARIAEMTIRKKIEQNEKEFSEESLGEYLFECRTGSKNHSTVIAKRREGYFIISFADKRDYCRFKTGKEDEILGESSAGYYSYRVRIKGVGGIEVIAINRVRGFEKETRETRTLIHERQHFINDTFDKFSSIEPSKYFSKDYPVLSDAIRKNSATIVFLANVKDEFLAHLRSSGGDRITTVSNLTPSFLGIYSHLKRRFSEDGQKELSSLMQDIEENLLVLAELLKTNDERAILIYHLIDIPLIKIPQRLKVLENFLSKNDEYREKYKEAREEVERNYRIKKIQEEIYKIYKFYPGELTEKEKNRNKVVADKLERLYYNIIREINLFKNVSKMRFNVDKLEQVNIKLEEQEMKTEKIKQKLKELREEYDELYKQL